MAAAMALSPVVTRRLDTVSLLIGCLLGLAITPDWDLNTRRVRWLGRLQFVDEYAKLVPHRSRISHWPVLGTLIRFALSFTLPVLLAGLVADWWPPFWWVLGIFLGLCWADVLHICTDKIGTWLKHKSTSSRGRRR